MGYAVCHIVVEWSSLLALVHMETKALLLSFQLQTMHSVVGKTPCTQIKAIQKQVYMNKYQKSLISIWATLLGFGQSLLPDRPRSFVVKAGEENVKHIRVPIHRMSFNALLDILERKGVSCVTQYMSEYDSPQEARASRTCCPLGRGSS